MFSDRNRCLSPLPIGCKVVIVRREDLIVLESQNAFFFLVVILKLERYLIQNTFLSV